MQARAVLDARLFSQIATLVRHRIASGRLVPGDRLPSLREGAIEWGVNLHTVRRAYALLESEGLVETSDRRGTIVYGAPTKTPARSSADIESFLSWTAAAAETRFGLSRQELAARLLNDATSSAPIWVLECSESLASDLARQVAERFGREVNPWLVSRASELPNGHYLGTYYHFAELQAALADRRHAPAFFAVRFKPEFIEAVRTHGQSAGRLVILAVESRSGRAIVSDLREALGDAIPLELITTKRPKAVLSQLPRGVPVVVSPENFDRLSPTERMHPDRFPVSMEPLESDLEQIGNALGLSVQAGIND